MSQPTPQAELPFHLTGNFAPIFEERTEFDLEVTGAIPPELSGRFFRNGSNPRSGWSPHWFLGNGMVHGVELAGGRATWYRNRYVRTPLLEDPDAPRISGDGEIDRERSCANTHVISHAGRILALEEGSFPFELTKELETVGAHDFGGRLDTAMTAHPRICPETGELLFFGYGWLPPYLVYYRVSPDGVVVQREEIDVKGPTMMHDWNVTRNHVVFMDLPLVFDLELAVKGELPIRWSDDYGARLGVMPRKGGNQDVVWYEIDPCYVFHPMNSYEDGDRIVLDVARYEKLAFGPRDAGGTPAMLHRFTIDPRSRAVRSEPLDDRPAEFPRVRDRVVGLKHRYGYTAGGTQGPEDLGTSLYKYDLATGRRAVHDLRGCQAGEPVFAACPGSDGEDEGWVMTFAYDPATDKSDLLLIDATRFDAKPVARIHLPTRVPFGFHGSWIPDDASDAAR
jgi:carotenoid cleavage dioxygenase